MISTTKLFRSTAITLAASLVTVTSLPIATASAHDRHNVYKHYGHGTPLTRNGHKRFHKIYGPGHHGKYNYQSSLYDPYGKPYHGHHHKKHKRKKNKTGDLIAAGIIGLAVGALIANESSKNRNKPSYQYSDPNYGSYNGGYNSGGQHIPLNEYDTGVNSSNGGPDVITFNEAASLEPWTPGWREWCENRYRSFNVQTGTYRGYDGKNHFCTPTR